MSDHDPSETGIIQATLGYHLQLRYSSVNRSIGPRNEFFIYYFSKTGIYCLEKGNTRPLEITSGPFILDVLPLPVIWALDYLLHKVGSLFLVDLGVNGEQECENTLS